MGLKLIFLAVSSGSGGSTASSQDSASSWRRRQSGRSNFQRITEVLDRLDPAVVARAAAGIGDRDDEIPLRPEKRTR